MQQIDRYHFRILEVLYAKWPRGVTGDEIIKHIHNNNESTFNESDLSEQMFEFINIGYIKKGDAPSTLPDNETRYYLTPTMYMIISEKSKKSNFIFLLKLWINIMWKI